MAKKTQTDGPRIFISYSRRDAAIMRRLEERLKAAGAEMWVDHAGIRGGDNLPKRISDALEWCNILLLLWSASAQKSTWVEKEWTNAEALERKIIPCLLDEAPLPGILVNKLYVDFRDFDKGIAELFGSLYLTQPSVTSASILSPQRVPRVNHGQLIDIPTSIKPKPLPSLPIIQLRARPLENLSVDDVKKMLKEKNLFAIDWNQGGKGLRHEYEAIESHGDKLVIDHATGLTWQKGGSEFVNYARAATYIQELDAKKYGGYNDWRLPTLEEAMSLMEPEQHDGLYLAPVFGRQQYWIWTADKYGAGVAWVVGFYVGDCIHDDLDNGLYVRAVR